jgi:cellulose synthase/poly-beta-1,6-N-acetylglucosamine synthase-like glycosyltransferase
LISGPVGPAEKRNLGAREAKADILVFIDDDAYPESNWLSKAFDVFKETGTYALGAPAVTPPNSPFLEKISGRVLESVLTSAGTLYRHVPKERKFIEDYPTVNLFVMKDVFLKVGGFDKRYWSGEDTKLCLDMVKEKGKRFLYDPAPVVYHHRRALFLPYLKQISRYGKHRGQFAKIFPETSRKLAYFVPSIFVSWIVFGLFLSLAIPLLWPVYLLPLWIYLLVLIVEGVRVTGSGRSLKFSLYFMQGVFLTHLVYGLNFVVGFVTAPRLELREIDEVTGNYLGG